MFDTHCHLDSEAFGADRDAVLERARRAGVDRLVIPSVGPAGWQPLLDWSRGRPGLQVGLGIHPQLLPQMDQRDDGRHLARLDALLSAGGVAAVGECGLDGTVTAQAPMERQRAVFRAHLELARRHRLPLLVHCFKAHDELQALFSELAPPPSVLHSFSGSADQVRAYLRWDLRFAFAGPITYENARRGPAAARAVPADRLLVETDAPDQTPRPHRGRCEPAHLVEVVAGLARALGRDASEVAALTDANARTLFGP
jgi:TatD DNase family protein